MFRTSQYLAMHFTPINLAVNLLIHTSYNCYAITADDVEAQGNFFTGYFLFYWSDNALGGFLEDEVHAAVAGVQEADHCASVDCEDGYALWNRMLVCLRGMK